LGINKLFINPTKPDVTDFTGYR